VIPTLALDLPTAFFLGSLVALVARREVRATPDPFGPAFRLAVAYGAWFALVDTYFLIRFPDWMFVYFHDPRAYPMPLVAVIFVSSVVAAAASGEALTQALITRGRTGLGLALFVWGLAAYAAIFAATWDEYMHLGTYAEYLAGRARPIAQVPEFARSLNIAAVLLVVPGAALLAPLVRRSRRLALGRG
jgi:hypothetical protein